jgi:hypothetical protein
VGGKGLEQPRIFHDISGFLESRGAESGALGTQGGVLDPELRAIVDAWPALPEPIKAGILAMIRAGRMGESGR